MITDAKHLERVTAQLVTDIATLVGMWVDEEVGACAPRSSPDGPSGGGPGDPTSSAAGHQAKYRDRDQIGNLLLHLAAKAREAVGRREPREPHKPCGCCKREMATHGDNCWACDRFLHVMGRRCTDDVHDGRPRTRMCECPAWCCEVCPDRAAEGRSVSERCKRAMTRARKTA